MLSITWERTYFRVKKKVMVNTILSHIYTNEEWKDGRIMKKERARNHSKCRTLNADFWWKEKRIGSKKCQPSNVIVKCKSDQGVRAPLVGRQTWFLLRACSSLWCCVRHAYPYQQSSRCCASSGRHCNNVTNFCFKYKLVPTSNSWAINLALGMSIQLESDDWLNWKNRGLVPKYFAQNNSSRSTQNRVHWL